MRRQFNIGFQVALLAIIGLQTSPLRAEEVPNLVSTEVLLTSAAGHKLAVMEPVQFSSDNTRAAQVQIDPLMTRQTVTGIGTSFTESSAFVLAHLPESARRSVMAQLFSDQGANFSLARTTIGATDFRLKASMTTRRSPMI